MKCAALIVLTVLLASPVFAADAPPSKPPTVAEVQAELAQYKAALSVAIQQRDAAQKAYADLVVNDAARAAMPSK